MELPPDLSNFKEIKKKEIMKKKKIVKKRYSEFTDLSNVTDENPTNLENFLSIGCISDTHLSHDRWINSMKNLQDVDVIIHCGDFLDKKLFKYKKQDEWIDSLKNFNNFLGKFPKVKFKFVISGNHDQLDRLNYTKKDIQKYFTNAIYLQDESYNLDVLKSYPNKKILNKKSKNIIFYGVHYNSQMKRKLGYSKNKWNKIDINSNVLICHQPPFNILDLAWGRKYKSKDICPICYESHYMYAHVSTVNI